MKRICLVLLASAMILPAKAQIDSKKEIEADIELTGGTHSMYPTGQPVPTKAPKGYKPFYISHVGRHGARYALGSTIYEDVLKVWNDAAGKDLLTEEGKTLYEAYIGLYPQLAHREGQLTFKGQEQHRLIASQMMRNYPEVFKGQTHAEVVSTNVHRSIVSMYSCLQQLEEMDKTFWYNADYGYPYQAYLLPEFAEFSTERKAKADKKQRKFRKEILDADAIVGRWFTNPKEVVENSQSFCRTMHSVLATLDNLDIEVPEVLYTMFTPEERYSIWRFNNYRHYTNYGMSPDVENIRPAAMNPLLQDIVERANEDWANGVQLRLRYAHDTTIMPLLSLLGVNGMNCVVTDPYKVENYWRNYDIPMAANLQLVFFRSKKNPEILVQVLLNGKEATLPLEMAAPGCFYRWEDIKGLAAK